MPFLLSWWLLQHLAEADDLPPFLCTTQTVLTKPGWQCHLDL